MHPDSVDLLLVRHERTSLNEENRYQGSLDPGLTESGRERARLLGRVLEETLSEEFVVWSSTLRRSRQTATLAFPDREIHTDSRLVELDFGELEGLTHEEAEERIGDPYRDWLRAPEDEAPPGGESPLALRRRVLRWIRDLPPGSTHVAVMHLLPVKTLAWCVLDVAPSQLRPLRIDPGDWLRLRVAEHPSLAAPSPSTGE